MKTIRIFFSILLMFFLSCSSTQSGSENTSVPKTSGINTSDDTLIKIYGLIKTDKDNVYIASNWKSKSMVTYTVIGEKKTELALRKDKYALVSGILTKKQIWSGTLEVKRIISIDDSPDPKKENISGFINRRPGR